jgi:hypothetical protein
MEQHRASPAGKHILHHSPQQLGTTAKQVPHGTKDHMMIVKLAAVIGPPQHLCCWILICARPPAVLNGPCQEGQHAPLAAERKEPVHVPVCLPLCGLP